MLLIGLLPLACSGIFPMPKDITAHAGLAIKKCPQTCPQANVMEALFSGDSLCPDMSRFVPADKNYEKGQYDWSFTPQMLRSILCIRYYDMIAW